MHAPPPPHTQQLHLFTNTYNQAYKTFAPTSSPRQLTNLLTSLLPGAPCICFSPEAYFAHVTRSCSFSSFHLLPTAVAGSRVWITSRSSAAFDYLHRCFPSLARKIKRRFYFVHGASSVRLVEGEVTLGSAELLVWCWVNCGGPVPTNWMPDRTPDGGSSIGLLSGLFKYNSHPLGFRSIL